MRTRRLARTRRRWPFALAAALLVLAAGGYAAFRIATHELSEPASIAAAVERFRALPATTRALAPALRGRAPEPGVYVYETRGFEVSHVLGTRRHAYSDRTAITVSVTPAGCLRQRWDALATRWDATLACPRSDAGWRLVSQSEEHEFAGHVDRRAYVCTRDSTARPAKLTTGARWFSHCAIPGTTTVDRVTVLGPRLVTLDGRPTRTLLLRTRTRVSGETTGVGTTFTWIARDTGLVVRRRIANASSTDTLVGGVRYEERAKLVLTDPRPRR